VAAAAFLVAPALERFVPNPVMVIALLIGIAVHYVARKPVFQPGLSFCIKRVLRWAVALLGLRIAFGDIISLGLPTAGLISIAMAATVLSGVLFSRLFRLGDAYGALVGAATGICGASAALATASVIPGYANKDRDVAFVVIAANALATFAMLLYPQLCILLGFDEYVSGVFLGGTIHDVAQVVGAGYAISETAGNTAVIVKLFRVFLLLPIVIAIGAWFVRSESITDRTKLPFPMFAVVFLLLCVLNSAVSYFPDVQAVYAPAREALIQVSTAGLLVAIAALGLGTSLHAIFALSWRHMGTMLGATAVILAFVTGGLIVLR
jgi:uncharacterized integral membrane protein (TIGR00698 family)